MGDPPDPPGRAPAQSLPPVRPDLGRGLSLWQLVLADFRGLVALEPDRSLRRHLDVLAQPGFYAVLIFRLSVVCHRAGLIPVARIFFLLNQLLFATEMSPRARVGPGLVVPHPICTGFSGSTRIGRNVVLLTGTHLGVGGYDEPSRDGFPTIGDGCRIMDGAKVLGPVEIGPGAVIGANALVMRSIPAGAVVVSPPARVVRIQRPDGDQDLATP
jgi:serine O-acetyltransferase